LVLTLTNPSFKEIGDTQREEAGKHGYDVLVSVTSRRTP
jgi:hypothetical protein